jgi:hypothetical protein
MKGGDGKYFATATIYQEFKGFNGDNIIYVDKQTKQISIMLEYVYDEFYKMWQWIILLDDIQSINTT